MPNISHVTIAASPSTRSVRFALQALLTRFRRHQKISTFLELNEHHLADIGIARSDLLNGYVAGATRARRMMASGSTSGCCNVRANPAKTFRDARMSRVGFVRLIIDEGRGAKAFGDLGCRSRRLH
jgi:uncharacterized protein YjiS (DUF1127 family)